MKNNSKEYLFELLQALVEGNILDIYDDTYITVKNPKYKEDDGSDPYLCLSINQIRRILGV